MHKLSITVVLALVAFAALSGFGLLYRDDPGLPQAVVRRTPDTASAITLLEARVQERPGDAISLALLGDLYHRRVRERGDLPSLLQAEAALTRSLELLPGAVSVQASLASVLYSQHRFDEALTVAEDAYQADPRALQALAVIGDSRLALGDYSMAERAYAELFQRDSSPPTLARLAHHDELRGRVEEATRMLEAAALLEAETGGSGEPLAWFLVRLGDLAFASGAYAEAERSYLAALDAWEDYHPALAGLARVSAARLRLQDAIDWYQQAIARVPQLEWVAALGDLYALAGEADASQVQFATVEAIGRLSALNQRLYNRPLATFYADHDRNGETALRLAEAELAVRQDVYGYDAYAWALYRNGRLSDAREASDRARALGTKDARILYHAGLISAALGEEDRAGGELRAALELSPAFDPLHAPQARLVLEELEAQP